ncbi:hypothetical protein BT69DRAFT_1346657 [Atractiella rhizophila]|nr:hypothetical protein BT69DRAFT_1346657 [Atractiella rhizophila]
MKCVNLSAGPWSVWIRVLGSCPNIQISIISLAPPSQKKRRDAIWRVIARLQLLQRLGIQSPQGDGPRRWRSDDLSSLLSKEFRMLDRLELQGWDLSQFVELRNAKVVKRLRILQFTSCLLSEQAFKSTLPFLFRNPEHRPYIIPHFQQRQIRLRSCFSTLLPPQNLISHLHEHTTFVQGLWFELRDRRRKGIERDMIVLPKPIDSHIAKFQGLRLLVLDGGHERSNMISPYILFSLVDCPFLWMLCLNWIFVDLDSLVPFLSHQFRYRSLWPKVGEKYAGETYRGFIISLTFFWGDSKWDADDFTSALRLIDEEENASEYMKCWDDGDEGDLSYEGAWFSVVFNGGGVGPNDTEDFWC